LELERRPEKFPEPQELEFDFKEDAEPESK
jgi:hypothetical protein